MGTTVIPASTCKAAAAALLATVLFLTQILVLPGCGSRVEETSAGDAGEAREAGSEAGRIGETVLGERHIGHLQEFDSLDAEWFADTNAGLVSLVYQLMQGYAKWVYVQEHYHEVGVDYYDEEELRKYEAKFYAAAALLARATRIEEGDTEALKAAYDERVAIIQEADPLSKGYFSELADAGVGIAAPEVESVKIDEFLTHAPTDGISWRPKDEFYLDDITKRGLVERIYNQMWSVDDEICELYNEAIDNGGSCDPHLILYRNIFTAQADLLVRVLATDEEDAVALDGEYGEMLSMFGIPDNRG